MKAKSSNNTVIVAYDANIDQAEENDSLGRYDIKDLIEKYEDFKNDQGFVVMNKEFTRYHPNASPSIIDHILVITKPYL